MPIPNRELYDNFGKLRNGIQHFNSPGYDVSDDTLRFIFGVIDPFINECWGLYAINYDEEAEHYMWVTRLLGDEILFLVPPEASSRFTEWESELSDASEKYRGEMSARFRKASEREATASRPP